MKGLGKLLVLLALVAGVASLSCFVTGRIFPPVSAGTTTDTDVHQWVHRQLGLSADQDKALDAQEEQFASQRKACIAEIQQANAELATVLMEDKMYSRRVVAAVEKIHHAQSDLEKATLEHILSMKGVLTPEQFDKLLKLTGDALNENSKL